MNELKKYISISTIVEVIIFWVIIYKFIAPNWGWLNAQPKLMQFALAALAVFVIRMMKTGTAAAPSASSGTPWLKNFASVIWIILIGPLVLWFDVVVGLNIFPSFGAWMWHLETSFLVIGIGLFVARFLVNTSESWKAFHTILIIVFVCVLLGSYAYDTLVVNMDRLYVEIDDKNNTTYSYDPATVYRTEIQGGTFVEVWASNLGDVDIDYSLQTKAPGIHINKVDVDFPNQVVGNLRQVDFYRSPDSVCATRPEPLGMLFFYLLQSDSSYIPIETKWEYWGTNGGHTILRIPSGANGILCAMVNANLKNSSGRYAIKYIARKTNTQRNIERAQRLTEETVFSVFGEGKANDNQVVHLKRFVGKHGETMTIGQFPRNAQIAMVLRSGNIKPDFDVVVKDDETKQFERIKVADRHIIMLKDLDSSDKRLGLFPTVSQPTGGEIAAKLIHPKDKSRVFSVDFYAIRNLK